MLAKHDLALRMRAIGWRDTLRARHDDAKRARAKRRPRLPQTAALAILVTKGTVAELSERSERRTPFRRSA